MKDFVVIGLGNFGSSVARELAERKYTVLAIDKKEERVNEIAEFVTHAVVLDATDEKALRDVGIEGSDAAIISLGDDVAASIMATLIIKEIGIPEIVVKAVNQLHAKVLRKLGATRIVFPERDMAIRLVETLTHPSIFEHLSLSSSHSLIEIVAPPSFHDKSIREIGLRTRYGVNLIAIKRPKVSVSQKGTTVQEEVIVSPSPDEIISKGDILVVIGKTEDLERLKKVE
ncbi:TrkA family potassium uptake protein [bacterium]|nr:MAG: TrkA family potassium uptake protein [bacterium]RKZ27107.1 MAG: TrkA family potassium uptake protein [bacterium]